MFDYLLYISCFAILALTTWRLLGTRFGVLYSPAAAISIRLTNVRASSEFTKQSRSRMDSDPWKTLHAWILAEQRRNFSQLRSEADDSAATVESSSNIGLPQSVVNSSTDFRLPFVRGNAAVLICLFQNEQGEIRVILTKRADTLSSHSGEVALPGGKRDKTDADDVATALREAKEEIGLDPSLVKIVDTIEPFVSKKLLKVTPIIGLLTERSKFRPIPNAAEVDTVFDAPLEMFLKNENYRYKDIKLFGYSYRIHFFDYEENNKKFTIWGLTAAILIRCASVIYKLPPSFEELQQKKNDPSRL